MLDPGSAVHHPHTHTPTHTVEEFKGQRAKLVVQFSEKLSRTACGEGVVVRTVTIII